VEDTPLSLNMSSKSFSWNTTTSSSVTVTCGGDYSYEVSYNGSENAGAYNYEWLNCSQSGNKITFKPNRPNYSASSRKAIITVTCGNQSKTLTVTQSACSEGTPSINAYKDTTKLYNNDNIGTFGTSGDDSFALKVKVDNIRKITVNLKNKATDELVKEITKLADGSSKEITLFNYNELNLSPGEYYIDIYSSNSDTENDFWAQRGETIRLYFDVVKGSTSTTDLSLSKSSETFEWNNTDGSDVTVTCDEDFSYKVSYDGTEEAGAYNYEWLDCSVSGNKITFEANRPNYSKSSRKATITVTCGEQSKTLTVTQSAGTEGAPQINSMYFWDREITNGEDIGTFGTTGEDVFNLKLNVSNIRKITVNLWKIGDTYATKKETATINGSEQTVDFYINITDSNGNPLSPGEYRLDIWTSNSDFDNDFWAQRLELYNAYFNVEDNTSTHEHSYSTHYEAEHPHKYYNKCDCGDRYYTGETKYVASCSECTPSDDVVSDKDFSSFDEAASMISYVYSSDWSKVGTINYVEQYWSSGNDSYYYTDSNHTNGYWLNNSQADGKCTRAASCMALSYMGITAFPKNVSPTNSPYKTYIESLGLTMVGDGQESCGYNYSVSLATFNEWYNRYANDKTGKYSPIVIHTEYASGKHSFAVFGRDTNNANTYYVIDSGHGEYLGKIELTEVNGKIRIKKYSTASVASSSKYSSDYSIIGVWQYVNDAAVENNGTIDLTDSKFDNMGSSYLESQYYKNLSNIVLTGNYPQDMIAIAKSQVGYVEDSNGSSAYGRFWGNDSSWCAHFVQWCAKLVGIVGNDKLFTGTGGAAKPYSMLKDYKFEVWYFYINNNGGINYTDSSDLSWKTDDDKVHNFTGVDDGSILSQGVKADFTPIQGDLIYFRPSSDPDRWGHVGIVDKVENGYVYFYDGNGQGNGDVVNGQGQNNGVAYRRVKLTNDYITAYARPNYGTGSNVTSNLTVEPSSIEFMYGAGNEDDIKISCDADYTYTVDYGLSADDMYNYAYEWLIITENASGINVRTKSVNYSNNKRTAVITIVSGSERKSVTVTQDGTPHDPLFNVWKDEHNQLENGSDLGIKQEEITISVEHFNIQRLHARIYTEDGEPTNCIVEKDLKSDLSSFNLTIPFIGDNDVAYLPAGKYILKITGSNSNIKNDYYAQRIVYEFTFTIKTLQNEMFEQAKLAREEGYNYFLAWYHAIFNKAGYDTSFKEYCDTLLYNFFAEDYDRKKVSTSALKIWGGLTSDAVLVEEDLYTALLMKMLSGEYVDPNHNGGDSNEIASVISVLSSDLPSDLNKSLADFWGIPASELKDYLKNVDKNSFKGAFKHFLNGPLSTAWTKIQGIADIVDKCIDLYKDASEFYVKLCQLNDIIVNGATDMQYLLKELANNTNNSLLLRNAANTLYAYMTGDDFYAQLGMIVSELLKEETQVARTQLMKALRKTIKQTAVGRALYVAVDSIDALLGLSDEASSMYTICALAEMQDAIFDAVKNIRLKYKSNPTLQNASAYISSMEACFLFAYHTSYYVDAHLETVYKKGLIKDWVRNEENYETYKDVLSSSKLHILKMRVLFYQNPLELFDGCLESMGYEYAVVYDDNGGFNGPGSQLKEHNTDLVITSAKPTRNGYTFLGWSENKNASAAQYKSGAKYSENESITLYAIWKQNTYAIKYDANGGASAPETQIKYGGKPLTLDNLIIIRDGYVFKGWALTANATEALYYPGETLLTDGSKTLYAVWQKSEEECKHEGLRFWESDGTSHWTTCDCGEVLDMDLCSGGTATCKELASCEVCGLEYGFLSSHAYSNWETISEPTENSDGLKQRICSVCGDIDEEILESINHEHSYSDSWKSNSYNHWKECTCGETSELNAHSGGTATCESRAICETCGKHYGGYKNHSYSEWETVTEPTEISYGLKQRTCSVCNDIEEKRIDKLEHEHDYGNEWESNTYNHWKECTCGDIIELNSHSGGTSTCESKAICEECGKSYGSYEEHSYGEWETVTEPTESSDGLKQRSCSVCGDVEEEVIPKIEHDHVHNYSSDWKFDIVSHWKECSCTAISELNQHSGGTATCKDPAVCGICGQKYGSVSDHSYKWMNKLDADHSNIGMDSHYRCEVCGKYFNSDKTEVDKDSLILPALGHSGGTSTCTTKAVCGVCGESYGEFGEHDYLHIEKIDATHTENGVKEHFYCCECNKRFDMNKNEVSKDSLIIVAEGHRGGAATCTSKAICDVCGEAYGELAAHSYDYSTYHNNESEHWHKCSNCNARTNVHAHIPGPEATNTEPQTCTECGYILAETIIIYGDIDDDGEINMDDVIKLLRHVSKAQVVTDPKLLAAGEIIEDGQLNMDDVIRLLRFVSKAIPNLK